MPESDDLLVLLAIRLLGVARTDSLAGRLGWPEDAVRSSLDSPDLTDCVVRVKGRLSGWALTPSGRRRGEQLLGEELDFRGVRLEIESAYDSFLSLNEVVLQACSDWQVRAIGGDLVPNDHDDADHDRRVIERIDQLRRSSEPVLDKATHSLPRFGHYSARLSQAVHRAQCGEQDWITKPLIDSFHTVWFELHEDFLATLGRTRNAELRRDVESTREAVGIRPSGTR